MFIFIFSLYSLYILCCYLVDSLLITISKFLQPIEIPTTLVERLNSRVVRVNEIVKEDRMKKACFLCMLVFPVVLLVSMPHVAVSGGVPDSHIKFHQKMGCSFSMFVGNQDYIRTYGSIQNPEPLTSQGFSDVKKGQRIEVTELGKNQWKVKNAATGEEKTVVLQPDPFESFLKQFPRKAKE